MPTRLSGRIYVTKGVRDSRQTQMHQNGAITLTSLFMSASRRVEFFCTPISPKTMGYLDYGNMLLCDGADSCEAAVVSNGGRDESVGIP